MSVRCISQVLEKSQHAGTELLMMVVLADFADDDGNSYPAVSSLARKCRMQRRNAQYILSVLQNSGELQISKNDGPKGCNRYRIVLSALGTATPVQPIALPVQHSAPVQSSAPVQYSAGGGAIQRTKGVQPIAPEPSLNRHRTVNGLFGLFWPAYPKKVKKKAALKAFEKINPTPEQLDQMLAALRLQVKALNWTGDQYTPHPATWLNDERWLDELPAVAAKSDRHPQWAINAGFANIDEAHNERCYVHNANEFREGKRIEKANA